MISSFNSCVSFFRSVDFPRHLFRPIKRANFRKRQNSISEILRASIFCPLRFFGVHLVATFRRIFNLTNPDSAAGQRTIQPNQKIFIFRLWNYSNFAPLFSKIRLWFNLILSSAVYPDDLQITNHYGVKFLVSRYRTFSGKKRPSVGYRRLRLFVTKEL